MLQLIFCLVLEERYTKNIVMKKFGKHSEIKYQLCKTFNEETTY